MWLATAVCGWHTKHRLCTRGKDCGNGRERLAADQAPEGKRQEKIDLVEVWIQVVDGGEREWHGLEHVTALSALQLSATGSLRPTGPPLDL